MANLFFPTLTSDLAFRAGIDVDPYSFFYSDNSESNEEYELDSEFSNNEYVLIDRNRGVWNVKDNNLIIKTRISIDNPQELFGVNGISVSYRSISVYLNWSSKKSNKKGSEFCFDFSQDGTVDKEMFVEIGKDILRESVQVSITFVVGSIFSFDVNENESFLAQQQGMCLGTLNKYRAMLEGKGSEFPLCKEDMGANEPLWILEYNSSDPTIDELNTSNLKVVINSSHEGYPLMDIDNVDKCTCFFKEVLASAYVAIITQIKEDGYLQQTVDRDCEDGSICDAIGYFINTFNIDVTSLPNMMRDVRKAIDKGI